MRSLGKMIIEEVKIQMRRTWEEELQVDTERKDIEGCLGGGH